MIALQSVSYSEMKEIEPILKIKVLIFGKVMIGAEPVSLERLDQELSILKEKRGAVWYYREEGAQEPPAIAAEVISLIIKHQLPISFSSKSDFSDYVDEDGKIHPRNN